ncbi:hypothetical protein G3I40_11440 [Streptomyces sp. SID14478]|uniref:hypothetical protein n=1 Tax=Streptomyces sp. SID14478 TaxID=2706073 RepID=UPI0013DA2770|nr:hypothetical protein [Streptomyces sp. SID14478]NEB75835.1 hypothetical protein [Streptomyces sp. SID14478]
MEHELADIERGDSRTFVIMAPLQAGLIVASAVLPSLPYAEAAILTVLAACTAWPWWAELACGSAAARRCGRATSATALSQLLAGQGMPLLTRLLQLSATLRTHPPLRLRRSWTRTVPWAGAR